MTDEDQDCSTMFMIKAVALVMGIGLAYGWGYSDASKGHR